VSLINAEAQAIIDRLRSVDQTRPYLPDIGNIEQAFAAHLTALNLPIRPVRFIKSINSAAWGAARGAAWGAAWGAARDAAWDAAISNALSDHKDYPKLRAIWMPIVDAFEAGLFIYWIQEREIFAMQRPLFRFRGQDLHGDGVPAVEYPNGECYYFWRGVRIPDAWGKVHSEHWDHAWLLTEKNAERRRVLIQGLGYHRIMAVLPNTLLHSDNGMELRRIEKDVDAEPIYLLKVICPSTGFVHALRVPPGVNTCEEARRTTFPWPDVDIAKET